MGSQHPPSSSSSAFLSPGGRCLCLWCRLLPGNAWPWQPAVAESWKGPDRRDFLQIIPFMFAAVVGQGPLAEGVLPDGPLVLQPPYLGLGERVVRNFKIPMLPLISTYIPP